MASFEMNQDMTIEILSHLPASVVQKFRTLNKECNKRTYDSSFLKLNLQRTNSVSGYFLEYREILTVHSAFVKDLGNSTPHGSEVSLDFLRPGKVKIEACDASHGILLCVNDRPVRGREPEYIVCKPTTKQYLVIPRPKTRYFTIALGLMVIRSNPIRYKILRLSKLPSKENKLDNFNPTFVCEVFDSDSFTWKRLTNVELPEDDFPKNSKPVASYGFLHWLTTNNNVPENLARDRSLKLARYEGKLGVISSRSKKGLGLSRDMGLEPVGFSSNDVVTLADVDRICLYNMNNEESQNLQIRAPNFFPLHYSTMSYFPLYSDFERVEFNRRFNAINWLSDYDEEIRGLMKCIFKLILYYALTMLASYMESSNSM
ncbi:unnamed protein product [Arabis nemorensis]|uniref:F-box associated domain-containing protein n=1 Tax=Arabis nemorensis TaxID=586526 RepID=A0A565AWW1_9BRAS|nr:unnamed protein product [Arabis nemorensis]